MLNLALVALLAGSLSGGGQDGGNKNGQAQASTPAASAVEAPAEDPRSIINDTYAHGMASDQAPIKIWVNYAYGEAEGRYDVNGESGEDVDLTLGGPLTGDLVTQRVGVGAQINFLNFPSFKLGAGGQLNLAMNSFQPGEDNPIMDDAVESSFGLQGVKVYGVARGRVLGIHAGYFFDLGDSTEVDGTTGIPTSLENSDGRDALFAGLDFDYPSERFRVFAGVDYFQLEDDDEDDTTSAEDESSDDIIMWNAGLGLKFSVFELGAAFLLRARQQDGGFGSDGASGNHIGTVAPYLRISPPRIPASLFIKGAVNDEYTDYGYALGGGNSIKPTIGFTAGITVGFE